MQSRKERKRALTESCRKSNKIFGNKMTIMDRVNECEQMSKVK